MDFLLTLFRKAFGDRQTRKLLRVDEIEAVFKRTHGKYIDPDGWAEIQGISQEDALAQLRAAAARGYLEKRALYEGSDSPIPFVVPLERVGTSVRPSEVGYLGPDKDREIRVRPIWTRDIFVAKE